MAVLAAVLLNNFNLHLQKEVSQEGLPKPTLLGYTWPMYYWVVSKMIFTNYLTESRNMEVEQITVKTSLAVLSAECLLIYEKYYLLAITEWT